MRIRRKSSFFSASTSFPPYSSSPSLAPSNSSSSITTNSLASSTDSSSTTPSNFYPFSSTLNASKRCQGLDLLVKAIHLVTAGSVVGVPYIQRRVVRRRRASLKFNGLILSRFDLINEQSEQEQMKKQIQSKTRSVSKRQSRAMAFPSESENSVVQSWSPKIRRRRSSKIGNRMCS
ncbi:hypothetical protein ACH5RR_001170 [Cinchona calisaya]|uniref:Uncharacterized protein n=1 Tax=Cinchona calisaya TaxID=153742 RepID=A0ABD3B2X4_9GENT